MIGQPADMQGFAKAYRTTANVQTVLGGISCAGALATGGHFPAAYGSAGLIVALLVAIRLPLHLPGGIGRRLRMARWVSFAMAALMSMAQVALFREFLENQGEGPNGEGAPGAFIIAMGFFAAVWLCPWLLTALRAVRCEREISRGKGAAGFPESTEL